MDILCAQDMPNENRQEGVLGTDISYPALPQMRDDLYLLLQIGSHKAQHISLSFRGPPGTYIKDNLPFCVQIY